MRATDRNFVVVAATAATAAVAHRVAARRRRRVPATASARKQRPLAVWRAATTTATKTRARSASALRRQRRRRRAVRRAGVPSALPCARSRWSRRRRSSSSAARCTLNDNDAHRLSRRPHGDCQQQALAPSCSPSNWRRRVCPPSPRLAIVVCRAVLLTGRAVCSLAQRVALSTGRHPPRRPPIGRRHDNFGLLDCSTVHLACDQLFR